MKKIMSILVIGILVFSGIGAVAINNDLSIEKIKENEKLVTKSESFTLSFSSLKVEQSKENYVEVDLENIDTYLSIPGEPVLPKIVKVIELPFGVTNVVVDVNIENIKETEIQNEVRPAPQHIILSSAQYNIPVKSEKNEEIYSSETPYPYQSYKYRVVCGLNGEKKRVTKVIVEIYPVKYSPKLEKLFIAEDSEIKITYDKPEISPFSANDKYDMVIIGPRKFKFFINRLVKHKNNVGIKTYFKTTESIYKDYDGVDKPEEIKRFIQYAIEENDIDYVLLIGGLNSYIYGNPREDANYGAKDWYVPVRYQNFFDDPEHPLSSEKIHDPGVISDLYYADIYKEGGLFEDWDSNDDGVIGAWNHPDPEIENDTIDMMPDVTVGRLACRNIIELKNVIDKIINYEKTSYGKEWFKRAVVVSGDGFMDQEDLDFQWDTNGLPNGKYTIYAQSKADDKPFGVPDVIHVTIDKDTCTQLTFNHDDHLRITGYPTNPIAEIVSVSDGDILGCNDLNYEPGEGEAYGNGDNGWANINYTDGILHIRGKTYDPSPYGVETDIHVWVLNEEDQVVFDDWRYCQKTYFEGEWVTGEKMLKGGGGALYYMPEDFKRDICWSSNGTYAGPDDIINALNPGCGFAFISGHGSPNTWTDHFPGIPGNRRHGSVPSINVIGFKPSSIPLLPKIPYLELNKLSNKNKLPVFLIGGCHNSQFNVSVIYGLTDPKNEKNSWCHGMPQPECFSWYLVQLKGRGAIATIGNTGLGYGAIGEDCTTEGLDGGICIEFFKQYGIEYEANDGSAILGDVFYNTLSTYHTTYDMDFLDHAKSLTQWVLLGDPSLMIGGYS